MSIHKHNTPPAGAPPAAKQPPSGTPPAAPAKRKASSARGTKALILTASVAATIGGWAAFSTHPPEEADVPSDVAVAQVQPTATARSATAAVPGAAGPAATAVPRATQQPAAGAARQTAPQVVQPTPTVRPTATPQQQQMQPQPQTQTQPRRPAARSRSSR